MPVMECNADGKPGYKYGDQGKCYTYTAGNEQSRAAAKTKAEKQGQAIEINKQIAKAAEFDVIKTDDDNNLAFGWAYIAISKEGKQEYDYSGEFLEDINELEMAAYAFNIAFRESGEMHKGEAKGVLVESMMFTKEKLEKLGLPEDILPQGLWVGFYFPDDEVFEKVRGGVYKMFSIHGKAHKEVVEDE